MSVKSARVIIITLLISSILLYTGCSQSPVQENSPEQPVTETGSNPEENVSPETPENSAQAEPIVFEDAVFEKLVKKELGKEEVFPFDLEPFTSISIAADEFLFLAGNGIPEKSIIHFNEDSFEYDGIRYEGYGTLRSLADLKHFPKLTNLKITLQPEIDYMTVQAKS